MGQAPRPIVISDLRGGRNGTDPPLTLPDNQCVEAENVDWKDAAVARKRGGATALSMTGGTTLGDIASSLIRHVPGNTETAAELWTVDGDLSPVKRLAGGATWADVTVDDALNTLPQDMVGVSFNGKLFLAYSSAVDRLHCYDPSLAVPRVRRVGLNPGTNQPGVANTGAGAYAATQRFYRARFLQLSGGTIVRWSEPTPPIAFTPSGAGAAVRVTMPALPGEGETHWQVEVSLDNATFYRLIGQVVGTTTYDDSAATTTYSANPLSDPLGTYSLPTRVKYLMTDGNRLLMAENFSTGFHSRVWFTAVLGSTDQGDDERIPSTTTQKFFVDLNENDGGAITGMGGPLNGSPYIFKQREVWKMTPTGSVTTPYVVRKLRDDIGCVAHKSIVVGQDALGRAALYFMSHRGPYRITADGVIEYLGRDNEDIWRTVNLGAATVLAHSVYYPDLHQWWLWISTGSSDTPDVKMMFDAQLGFPDQNGQIRGGWAKHTGSSAAARCSCLFSNTVGATMSRDLKPYIGRSAINTIWKCDTADVDDAGTDFQAKVTTRPLMTTPDLLRKSGIGESTIVAKAATSMSVSVTIARDFGKETRTHTVSIAPAASETRVVKKAEGSEMGEADVIQMTIGDSAANEQVWTVDALIVPVTTQEMR